MELTCRKINSTDDFEHIASMIFSVDPYCYKDLFGDLERAKKVIPILMNNPKSTFYKDNYFVAVNEVKIIGIILFFFHFTKWDNELIVDAFGELNLPLPKTFYSVSKYFEEDYNYYSVGASTCQVNVLKEYQNKGVATFLLKSVLDIYGKSDIQLNVSKDNEVAIHLYEKFGFFKINEHKDYGGEGQPEVISCLMYRPGKVD